MENLLVLKISDFIAIDENNLFKDSQSEKTKLLLELTQNNFVARR